VKACTRALAHQRLNLRAALEPIQIDAAQNSALEPLRSSTEEGPLSTLTHPHQHLHRQPPSPSLACTPTPCGPIGRNPSPSVPFSAFAVPRHEVDGEEYTAHRALGPRTLGPPPVPAPLLPAAASLPSCRGAGKTPLLRWHGRGGLRLRTPARRRGRRCASTRTSAQQGPIPLSSCGWMNLRHDQGSGSVRAQAGWYMVARGLQNRKACTAVLQ